MILHLSRCKIPYVSMNSMIVHVDYNPLKGMLVLISSLKLSIVPYAASPKSRGHSRTAFANISMSSCFASFIVHWILNFVDQQGFQSGPVPGTFTRLRSACGIFFLKKLMITSIAEFSHSNFESWRDIPCFKNNFTLEW